MIYFSSVQQTEALAFLAALGVTKSNQKIVRSLNDVRGFSPQHFLIIENATAMRIPSEIIDEVQREGWTMVHVKATAAHFHQATEEPDPNLESDDDYRARIIAGCRTDEVRESARIAAGIMLDRLGKICDIPRGVYIEKT